MQRGGEGLTSCEITRKKERSQDRGRRRDEREGHDDDVPGSHLLPDLSSRQMIRMDVGLYDLLQHVSLLLHEPQKTDHLLGVHRTRRRIVVESWIHQDGLLCRWIYDEELPCTGGRVKEGVDEGGLRIGRCRKVGLPGLKD